jgi:hypothetical protein
VLHNPWPTLLVVGMLYFVPCYMLSLLAQHLARSPEAREQMAIVAAETGLQAT